MKITIKIFLVVFALMALVVQSSVYAQDADTAFATPTIAGTDESYGGEDVVPDSIQTLEDFQGDYRGLDGRESASFSVWRVFGSLAIIILLIVGCVYLMRMTMSRGMRYDMKGRHIKVMDVVNLGVNKTLYLVEVGGRAILMGSTDKGMQFIADVTGGGVEESFGGYAAEGGVDFGKNLNDAVNKPGSRDSVDGIREILEERLRRLDEDKE